MKRNIYKNISLVVLTLLATACQNNDDLDSAYDNDPNAVVVNANIGARQTRVSTESATVDKWDNGDAFCVKGGANSNMAVYTYNGTAWTVGNDYLTWNTTSTNDFTAWYPMSATYTTFTLPKNQIGGISNADWMTASVSDVSKPTNKQLDLEFRHKLSKVIINVTSYGDEYNNVAPTISNVKFYIAGTPSVSGVTVESNASSVTPSVTSQANGKPCYTAIILPGTYSNGTTFIEMTVSSSSGSGSQTLTVDVPTALTTAGLSAEKAYTYNLKVGKGSISIASVSVSDWGTHDMGSGTATEGPAGPAVGEFYYKDGTHSAKYQGTAQNPCIGIVIDVEKGLILSDQLSIGKTSWATQAGEEVPTRTTNADGREDIKLLKAISSDLSQYPAAKACDGYNVGGTGWYLPSRTDVSPLKGDAESAAKWKNIFITAGFTGTGTDRAADGIWTTTVEVDEQFNDVWGMHWISWDAGFKYEADSQYWKYVRCVKRVSL